MAEGTVDDDARGVVRVRVTWADGVVERSLERQIEIEDGRWALDEKLDADTLRSLRDRNSTVHSVIAFTGYLPERMRGEVHTFQIADFPG